MERSFSRWNFNNFGLWFTKKPIRRFVAHGYRKQLVFWKEGLQKKSAISWRNTRRYAKRQRSWWRKKRHDLGSSGRALLLHEIPVSNTSRSLRRVPKIPVQQFPTEAEKQAPGLTLKRVEVFLMPRSIPFQERLAMLCGSFQGWVRNGVFVRVSVREDSCVRTFSFFLKSEKVWKICNEFETGFKGTHAFQNTVYLRAWKLVSKCVFSFLLGRECPFVFRIEKSVGDTYSYVFLKIRTNGCNIFISNENVGSMPSTKINHTNRIPAFKFANPVLQHERNCSSNVHHRQWDMHFVLLNSSKTSKSCTKSWLHSSSVLTLFGKSSSIFLSSALKTRFFSKWLLTLSASRISLRKITRFYFTFVFREHCFNSAEVFFFISEE